MWGQERRVESSRAEDREEEKEMSIYRRRKTSMTLPTPTSFCSKLASQE